VVNALLAHHNNDLNVDMARDARSDSVLMRRIALVTMVFLTATSMATFFSMGFFQIQDGDGSLHVSQLVDLAPRRLHRAPDCLDGPALSACANVADLAVARCNEEQ
jgi:hypothetical protein